MVHALGTGRDVRGRSPTPGKATGPTDIIVMRDTGQVHPVNGVVRQIPRPATMDPGSWLVNHLESEDGDLLQRDGQEARGGVNVVGGASVLRCRLRRGER